MLLTVVWVIWFVFWMLCTGLGLIIYYCIKLVLGSNQADKYAFRITHFWGRVTILSTLSKVRVVGRENLVKPERLCVISNHQSLFDIPLLMGWLNIPLGFIAKQELRKVPIVSGWITAIHSAFIDRSNARKAIDSINSGIESIRRGHRIVIFPEGTRSKDGRLSEFKPGSLKLATSAEAVILPVTISGSRRIFEETKHIRNSSLVLTIHKAIYPEDVIYQDKTLLLNTLQQTIGNLETTQ
jgi:1-acyl-sn-glycerol-3-phosphate acyltransferase